MHRRERLTAKLRRAALVVGKALGPRVEMKPGSVSALLTGVLAMVLPAGLAREAARGAAMYDAAELVRDAGLAVARSFRSSPDPDPTDPMPEASRRSPM